MDAFLQDSLTFLHFYDVNGGNSLAAVLLDRYLGGASVERGAALLEADEWHVKLLEAAGVFKSAVALDAGGPIDLVFAGNHLSAIDDPSEVLEKAHAALNDKGLFVFVGYCGRPSGLNLSERDAIGRFLKGLPDELRHP